MERLMLKDFDEAYQLLQKAFISAELRPYDKMKDLFMQEQVIFYGYKEENRIVAVLTVWELDNCIFWENFAVDETMRGHGLGGRVLEEVKELYKDRIIVLEVEKPFDEMSTRRIGFYQRHDFHFNEYSYVQPSLDGLPSHVHLHVMTYPREIDHMTFEQIKAETFKVVYGL